MKKVQPSTKKETPTMPEEGHDVIQDTSKTEEGPMKAQEPVFFFPTEEVNKLNNYLTIAGQAEMNNILDYKQAFHKFVSMIQEGLKQK